MKLDLRRDWAPTWKGPEPSAVTPSLSGSTAPTQVSLAVGPPRLLALAGLLACLLLATHPAAAQIITQPWQVESSPVTDGIFSVAFDPDQRVFRAVGDMGVVLRRDGAAAGAGTWVQETTDIVGMQPQFLDLVCREGVGCAASGFDFVIENTTGSWRTLFSTPGSNFAYGPVWITEDEVFYGRLDFPLNFLFRQPLDGQPGLGVSVGPQPITDFCERSGELVTVDRSGNVSGYSFDLAQVERYLDMENQNLSTVGFLDPDCATVPGGPGAGASPGTTPGAVGIFQATPTTWSSRVLDGGSWMPGTGGLPSPGLILAVIDVTSKDPSGFPELLGVGQDPTSGFAGVWEFRQTLDGLDFRGPTTPAPVAMTNFYQVASSDDALGAGVGLEVMVGDGGLLVVRSFADPLSSLIFDDGFETGNFSMWSMSQP